MTASLNPSMPTGVRVYVLADIHGCLNLLEPLMEAVQQDIRKHPRCAPHIITLGDATCRGPDSKGVIDYLLHRMPPEAKVIHLCGTHEQFFSEFVLYGADSDPDWYEKHGARETLASYGVPFPVSLPTDQQLNEAARAITQKLPPDHLNYLREAPLSHMIGDYFFVHAGVRPGIPLDQQDPNDLVNIGKPFLDHTGLHDGKVVVHGHSVTNDPQVLPNRIGIDTGAYKTGRLTCLVLDGTEKSFLQTYRTETGEVAVRPSLRPASLTPQLPFAPRACHA